MARCAFAAECGKDLFVAFSCKRRGCDLVVTPNVPP